MMTGVRFRRLAASVMKAGGRERPILRSHPLWMLPILKITSPIQPGMAGRAFSSCFIRRLCGCIC